MQLQLLQQWSLASLSINTRPISCCKGGRFSAIEPVLCLNVVTSLFPFKVVLKLCRNVHA